MEQARQFDETLAFQRAQARLGTVGSILGLGVSQLGFGGAFGPGGAFDPTKAAPSGGDNFFPLTTANLAGT